MNIFSDAQSKASPKKKYGDVKTSIFYYITPMMLGMLILLFGTVSLNFETVKHNFETGHVALNGTILLVFFIGLIQATWNNFHLYKVGIFLNKIDDVVEGYDTSPDAVDKLDKMLEGPASLLNIKTTTKLMENLRTYGQLMVTDNDARMIKSKFGYRIRGGRGSVSFLTGVLVMFGLIGTFWGLLETIGSVANALNDIAKSSSSETSAADMDMGGIIGAISGPLQGMGLAFSASLFGLAGSLILGFYTHACASAQNKVIEDVSRWIDDRIPVPNAVHAEKGQQLKSAGGGAEGDLKAWLASFAYLSHKTEGRLGELCESLSNLGNGVSGIEKSLLALNLSQNDTNRLLEEGNAENSYLRSTGENVVLHAKHISQSTAGLEKGLKDVQSDLGEYIRTFEGASKERFQKQFSQFAHFEVLLREAIEKIPTQENPKILKELFAILSELKATQKVFIEKIDGVEQGFEKTRTEEIDAIINRMQDMIADLKKQASEHRGFESKKSRIFKFLTMSRRRKG